VIHAKELHARLTANEQEIFWAKLKTIVAKASVCEAFGSHVQLDEIFKIFMEKNPDIKDANELRQQFSIALWTDEEMRNKLAAFMCTKDSGGNHIADIIGNIPTLFEGLGVPTGEKEEDKEDNDDDQDEKEEKDEKEETDPSCKQVSASTLYLSRKKRAAKLRRERRKQKQTQPTTLAQITSKLAAEMKDMPNMQHELKEFFENPEMAEVYKNFVKRSKPGATLQEMLKDILACTKDMPQDENMRQQINALSEMSKQDMEKHVKGIMNTQGSETDQMTRMMEQMRVMNAAFST
jgi:hypothetical protein